MTAERIKAFSDGVIAIIITIMVISLRQPLGPRFADLRADAASLFAYVLSFVFLGIYWNNHHHLFQTVKRVTGGLLWANVNLLFWLSLIPYVTLWMARRHFAPDTVATYGAACVLCGLAYTIVQTVIVRSHGPDNSLGDVLGRDLKGKLSLVAYLVSIPLALAWRWGGIIIFIAVSLAWMVPDRRVEHFLDHHTAPE